MDSATVRVCGHDFTAYYIPQYSCDLILVRLYLPEYPDDILPIVSPWTVKMIRAALKQRMIDLAAALAHAIEQERLDP